MDLDRLTRQSETEWRVAPFGKMRVPAVIYPQSSFTSPAA